LLAVIYQEPHMFQTSVLCHKKHHTMLYKDNQNHPTNNKVTTGNPPAETEGTTAEVNTYSSLKSKTQTHILLATAIVEVRNKFGQYVPCRALLDSASQSHFIIERFVRFRLSKKRAHASIRGISDVNTATQYCVSILMRSRHTDWYSTLDCAILKNITGLTLTMKLDISNWKIPKDIVGC